MSAISHPACNVGRPFQQEQGERDWERAEGSGLQAEADQFFCVFTGLKDTYSIY